MTEQEYEAEELARYNAAAKKIDAANLQIDEEPPAADHEDAIAHLNALPKSHAIAKAREWTGRDDLSNFEEAVAAVRELLTGGDNESPQS